MIPAKQITMLPWFKNARRAFLNLSLTQGSHTNRTYYPKSSLVAMQESLRMKSTFSENE